MPSRCRFAAANPLRTVCRTICGVTAQLPRYQQGSGFGIKVSHPSCTSCPPAQSSQLTLQEQPGKCQRKLGAPMEQHKEGGHTQCQGLICPNCAILRTLQRAVFTNDPHYLQTPGPALQLLQLP